MKQRLYILLLVLCALYTTVATAQENDQPMVADIEYGRTITDTITDFAFFDWWYLNVDVGDKIVISMDAENGLQPLLGLLDGNGDLVARSDIDVAAPINGTAFLQHDAVTAGQYTIIASRDGRNEGTTTGSYILTATNRVQTQTERPNPFMETEFRCDEWLVTNALTFDFSEDVVIPEDVGPAEVTEFYRFSVYGLDGFEPVVRLLSDILVDRPLDCTDSARATVGSRVEFPTFDNPIEITEDNPDQITMVTLSNTGQGDPLGDVAVTIGAKDGTSGRFIVVMEGMAINNRNDEDEFLIRRGPLAGDMPLEIYVLGYPNTRLDPVATLYDTETDTSLFCDDIGVDDCSDLVDLTATEFIIGEDFATYTGDRFDVGLRIDDTQNRPQTLTVRSRASTSGNYLLVFVGELPAR